LKISDFKNDDSNEEMSDSDDDPEVMPKSIYLKLKASYEALEDEKEAIEKKLEILEKKFSDFEKHYDKMKMEYNEVGELRSLNRQLQERILDLTQGEFYKGFLCF
jgi:uncharacterized protein YaaN involved in tellurite resistance